MVADSQRLVRASGDAAEDRVAERHRLIAFYLPQFHPIPENDEWWGQGFTEWTNVVQARPRFRGHDQPRLPADLGFYDLRVPEVRATQAAMAAHAGIDGFCYYHYWFEGRRVLDRPFREVLESGDPAFPFMLCWANENWTRLWNGGDEAVLLEQRYSAADDEAHIEHLLPVFADPRYIRIDGRPVFVVYRADELPDPARTTDTWRERASRAGMDLYLCAAESRRSMAIDPAAAGFDATVQFLPQRPYLGRRVGYERLVDRGMRRLRPRSSFSFDRVYRYETLVQRTLEAEPPPYKRYPCVIPGWDNSPRRQGASSRIIVGSSPELYGAWLEETLRRFRPFSPEENFVFVNAWNEWGEGAYLEPDVRHGRAYLDATLAARRSVAARSPSSN